MTDQEKREQQQAELQWLQLKKDFATAPIAGETVLEKMKRKTRENPLVPMGCAVTLTALGLGLYSFRRGDKKTAQIMMRTRVIAQGFTITALLVGVVLTTMKD
ncbi:HIG1 domain family member 2A, mitochondrial [Phlebotomus argentipes]|uniref:HIG1 domain family member 2A, mitochondrial n=1 Tax=Phlebotomus argentipes TaxID=94469 RepID=UPI00289335DE|nr:HIG1 domain family member 2A, mitochondrial [Phlebotomus argentipes]